MKNLISQTGDPTGTGKEGESIFGLLHGTEARFFSLEEKPSIRHLRLGTVSFVNDGNDRLASQFIVTLAPALDSLDSQRHCPFGVVTEGFETISKLNDAYCAPDGRPYREIRILHTLVLDDPLEDPPGFSSALADRGLRTEPVDPFDPLFKIYGGQRVLSPAPTRERLLDSSGRPPDDVRFIGIGDEIQNKNDLSEDERKKLSNLSEEKANAEILELIGDIPDADIRPEDNVLFVCKLNPVTTSEDLELIFSRFGEIISCEVIEDKLTNRSLQYAFIEFSDAAACERAYFKMEGVLIDDRRIHVDFSQSVAKQRADYFRDLTRGRPRQPKTKQEPAVPPETRSAQRPVAQAVPPPPSRPSKWETSSPSRSPSPARGRSPSPKRGGGRGPPDAPAERERERERERGKETLALTPKGSSCDDRDRHPQSHHKRRSSRSRSRSRSASRHRDRREHRDAKRSRSREKNGSGKRRSRSKERSARRSHSRERTHHDRHHNKR